MIDYSVYSLEGCEIGDVESLHALIYTLDFPASTDCLSSAMIDDMSNDYGIAIANPVERKTELTVTDDFEKNYTCYPTITCDIVTVEWNKDGGNKEVLLTDISGKVLNKYTMQTSKMPIDLSPYSSGMYIIKIIDLITYDVKIEKIFKY